MKPLISVVITNYNYGQYVGKAIQSVANQTYPNLELLIYDDGSTDDSVSVIESMLSSTSLSNVKLIKQANKGIVKTRNLALQAITGDYFIFLDADDYFDAGFIENLYQIACETNADVVYPNWHVIELDTGIRYHTDFPEFSLEGLQRQELHLNPESLVKSSSVNDVKFQSDFVAEDWQFFLQLAFRGKKFELAKNCYTNYQVKANSRASSNSYTDDTFAFEAILDDFRPIYGDQVISAGFLTKKRMSELEVDRAAIRERLRIADISAISLSQKLEQLERKEKELYDIIAQKDVHIYNLENSKLGRLQRFLRKEFKK